MTAMTYSKSLSQKRATRCNDLVQYYMYRLTLITVLTWAYRVYILVCTYITHNSQGINMNLIKVLK